MSEQALKTGPPSLQKAPQQDDPSLEMLLQEALSNVPSEVALHEAAAAKEATVDAVLPRFTDIPSILRQAKRRRQLKRKDCGTSSMGQRSLDRDSKTLGNHARMPTEIPRQLTQSGFLSTVDCGPGGSTGQRPSWSSERVLEIMLVTKSVQRGLVVVRARLPMSDVPSRATAVRED
jgi:hypothetical protein